MSFVSDNSVKKKKEKRDSVMVAFGSSRFRFPRPTHRWSLVPIRQKAMRPDGREGEGPLALAYYIHRSDRL